MASNDKPPEEITMAMVLFGRKGSGRGSGNSKPPTEKQAEQKRQASKNQTLMKSLAAQQPCISENGQLCRSSKGGAARRTPRRQSSCRN